MQKWLAFVDSHWEMLLKGCRTSLSLAKIDPDDKSKTRRTADGVFQLSHATSVFKKYSKKCGAKGKKDKIVTFCRQPRWALIAIG